MRPSQSHSATSAISLASARRPTGLLATRLVDELRRHRRPEHRRVDGARADGVDPHADPGVLAARRPCVSPTTPCFAAVYADTVGAPRSPATDAQLTIEPPPDVDDRRDLVAHAGERAGEVDRDHPVPVLHRASAVRLAVLAVDAGGVERRVEAAEGARPCSPPRRATLSSSVTSQRKKVHSPSALSSASTAFPGLLVHVGERGRVAPAHERLRRGPPMPEPAPVTKTTFVAALGHHAVSRRSGAAAERRQPIDHDGVTVADDGLRTRSARAGRAATGRSSRIAVDDDQVGQRARFDDADRRRRIDQQLPGVAGAPAEHVGRRRGRRSAP